MPREQINLTDFLITHMRRRPGMFLVEPKLSNLALFLTGYHVGADDPYFNEHHGFISWFYDRKGLPLGSFWQTEFLLEANNDDRKALELYFNYLEQYWKEKHN